MAPSPSGYHLGGPEIAILVEALDLMLGPEDDRRPGAPEPLPDEKVPYSVLRRRLKGAAGISFFAGGHRWIGSELARQRQAVCGWLFSALAELLRDPRQDRRTLKEGFAAAMREVREHRQSMERPGVW